MTTTRRLAKTIVPRRYHGRLIGYAYETRSPVRRLRYRGRECFCPICQSAIHQFEPAGSPPRRNSRCPVCHSRERHRLLWCYLTERTDLFSGQVKTLLHMAPKYPIAKRLKAAPTINYVSADLQHPLAQLHFDITNIPFPENSFDVILCNHVLEHVLDDRAAMSELFRVLRPGGWGIFQVPIASFSESGEFRFVVNGDSGAYREFGGTTTYEDPSVVSPEERKRLFGQADHVRIYGQDYRDRLESVGFRVTIDNYAQQLDEATTTRMAINRDENVYFCVKPTD